MLDWQLCQICNPLEIKLLLLLVVVSVHANAHMQKAGFFHDADYSFCYVTLPNCKDEAVVVLGVCVDSRCIVLFSAISRVVVDVRLK